MSKLIDLTGQVFGRLTALEPVGKNKRGNYLWKCRCACGNFCVVSSYLLRNGKTRSCGCLHDEGNFKTHGLCNTKTYRIWENIKKRCYNPNHEQYGDYGGRGIKMFEGWISDFQAFYDYVSKLENFGEKGYTLDRINNDGNYEPSNVKWSTRTEQNRNRRNTVFVECNGEQITLAEAAELTGINYHTLYTRYSRDGLRGETLFKPKER